MSWVLKFNHNWLNTLFLVKKNTEIGLKKLVQLFEIMIDNKIFYLGNIIENWYII